MSVPGRRCQVSRVATHTDLASFDAGQGTTGTNTAMPRQWPAAVRGMEGTKRGGGRPVSKPCSTGRRGGENVLLTKTHDCSRAPTGTCPVNQPGLQVCTFIRSSCIVPSGQGAMWMGGRVAVSGMLHMYGLSEAVVDGYCHAGAASAG